MFPHRFYVEEEYMGEVNRAREYAKDNNMCLHCFKPLVSIGSMRSNGAGHDDWHTRKLHKKCWQTLMRGFNL